MSSPCNSLRDRQGEFLDRFPALAREAHSLGLTHLAQALISLSTAAAGGFTKEAEERLYPLRIQAVQESVAAIAAGPGSVEGVVQ